MLVCSVCLVGCSDIGTLVFNFFLIFNEIRAHSLKKFLILLVVFDFRTFDRGGSGGAGLLVGPGPMLGVMK